VASLALHDEAMSLELRETLGDCTHALPEHHRQLVNGDVPYHHSRPGGEEHEEKTECAIPDTAVLGDPEKHCLSTCHFRHGYRVALVPVRVAGDTVWMYRLSVPRPAAGGTKICR